MNDELMSKIIFALRLYALTTRTEDLEKLGYKVKVRRTIYGVNKHFYHNDGEVAVFKFDNYTNGYSVTTNNRTPPEFVRALGEFLS